MATVFRSHTNSIAIERKEDNRYRLKLQFDESHHKLEVTKIICMLLDTALLAFKCEVYDHSKII